MTAVAFDTLAYTQKLEKNGFTREQAEAAANANAEALKDMTAAQEPVTRKDLAIALATTKADLEKSIAETKHELPKWLIGMMIAQTALLAGMIALLKQ